MSTGNLNDGLIAYANGRMVVLRVPYPMGFYAKGFDGRIDDPEGRLEGTRPVGGERRSRAVADRRRQGIAPAGRALPAQAGSAGEVGLGPEPEKRGNGGDKLGRFHRLGEVALIAGSKHTGSVAFLRECGYGQGWRQMAAGPEFGDRRCSRPCRACRCR